MSFHSLISEGTGKMLQLVQRKVQRTFIYRQINAGMNLQTESKCECAQITYILWARIIAIII